MLGGRILSLTTEECVYEYKVQPEQFNPTGTATVKYLAPVTGGTIRIRSWLKGQERRKLFISSEAKDEKGNVVATMEEIWIAILK